MRAILRCAASAELKPISAASCMSMLCSLRLEAHKTSAHKSGPDQKYEFNVEMTCGGCSSAVERVLGRLEGVEKTEIDLEGKKVYVQTSLPSDVVLETLKKTGKATTFVGTC